jgi:hypothetical protein
MDCDGHLETINICAHVTILLDLVAEVATDFVVHRRSRPRPPMCGGPNQDHQELVSHLEAAGPRTS